MKILFLCTSNIHRSITAEDYFRSVTPSHEFKSAGLSEKYCKKHSSTLCSVELLDWANKIFVMEPMHLERIANYAGPHYSQKIEILGIDDIYQYNQPELIEVLRACKKLKFILDE